MQNFYGFPRRSDHSWALSLLLALLIFMPFAACASCVTSAAIQRPEERRIEQRPGAQPREKQVDDDEDNDEDEVDLDDSVPPAPPLTT